MEIFCVFIPLFPFNKGKRDLVLLLVHTPLSAPIHDPADDMSLWTTDVCTIDALGWQINGQGFIAKEVEWETLYLPSDWSYFESTDLCVNKGSIYIYIYIVLLFCPFRILMSVTGSGGIRLHNNKRKGKKKLYWIYKSLEWKKGITWSCSVMYSRQGKTIEASRELVFLWLKILVHAESMREKDLSWI